MITFKEFYDAAKKSGWLDQGRNSMDQSIGGVLRGGFEYDGYFYTNGAGWCDKVKIKSCQTVLIRSNQSD